MSQNVLFACRAPVRPNKTIPRKKCLFGGTKSRELGSQYLVQCLSWLADTATPGFGWETSKIGLVFFGKVSQIHCFSRQVRNPAGKNNNHLKCKENVMIFWKKKRDLFSDQFFCCSCCTFGGEKALFSHQPNFKGVSKKSSGLAFPLAFFLLSPYADLTFQSITEQGCQILPLEFLPNTPENNCTALSILQQII